MTSISEAMKKAGVKTGLAQAYAAACDELRKQGLSPKKALGCFATYIMKNREPRDGLLLDYLERCAADMTAKPAAEAESQVGSDTPAIGAPAPAASSEAKQPSFSEKPAKPKHKAKPQRATATQREAARRSMVSAHDALFDHYLVADPVGGLIGIGDVDYGSMDERIVDYATSAARKLSIGKKQTTDAIIFQTIQQRYPATFKSLIRDVVPSVELRSIIAEADRKARNLITNSMREHRNAILHEGQPSHA